MKDITLDDIKNHPINEELKEDYIRRLIIQNDWNKQAHLTRMKSSSYWIKCEIWEMSHDGNEPYSIEELLDHARLFYDDHIYTDEEWNKYFIPEINRAIKSEENFIRWYPGYLVKNKNKEEYAIVEHDYAEAFGGRNFTDLCLLFLDNEGNPEYSSAWHDYYDYELIDKDNIEKYLDIIRKYNNGDAAPINMDYQLAKNLGYGSIHTYESARSNKEIGDILIK